MSLCYYVESFDIKTDNSIPSISGDVNTDGNVVLGGDNAWIIHTPEPNSKTMYIAPIKADRKDWNWDKSVSIDENGNMTIRGSLTVNGDFTSTGNLQVNGNIKANGNIEGNRVKSAGGDLVIGNDTSGWTLQANGSRGPHELAFWNNGVGKIREHGRVLFGTDGNRWNDYVGWNTDIRDRITTAQNTANTAVNKLSSIYDIQVGAHRTEIKWQNVNGRGCCNDRINPQQVWFPRHFSNNNVRVFCTGIIDWADHDSRHNNSLITIRRVDRTGFVYSAEFVWWHARFDNVPDGFHVQYVAIQF